MARKTIVVCHGYSLAEYPSLWGVVDAAGNPKERFFGDWDHVCIGAGPGKVGRIRTAFEVACERCASKIIWSTGASFTADGISEAHYMHRVAHSLLRSDDAFDASELNRISLFDDMSERTSETMVNIGVMLYQMYDRTPLAIVHVSSANHISRVLRDALIHAERPYWRHEGVAAGTSYGGKGPADVVIDDLGKSVRPNVCSHGV